MVWRENCGTGRGILMSMLPISRYVPGKPLLQSVLSFLLCKTGNLMLDPGTVISGVISNFGASWSQLAWVPRAASFVCTG